MGAPWLILMEIVRMNLNIETEKAVAARAVAALQAGLGDKLVAVVLYGSRARGEGNQWSDWDLLVIAEDLPDNHWQRGQFLSQLLQACPAAVTVLARTPAEFEAHVSSLYLDIALDGRILHDPRGYATRKLSELRRLIERLGLYRERTAAGDYWRWRQQPQGRWELAWEPQREH